LKKTTLYLVRHCEVENPKNIIYGSLPGFKLSINGLKQAKSLVAFFTDKEISAIYSSPLERATETASIIAKKVGLRVKIDHNISEADYKNWDLLTFEQRRAQKDYKAYLENPEKIKYLGESIFDVERRVNKAIIEMVKNNAGKNIVAVTHGVPIVITRITLKNKPLKEVGKSYVPNASITKIVFNDRIEVEDVEYKIIAPARKEGP